MGFFDFLKIKKKDKREEVVRHKKVNEDYEVLPSATEGVAAPSLGSVRSIWQDTVASGLTPYELAAILQAAAEGDITAYLTLAEEMEERDLHYAGVLATRKIAISKLEMQVIAPTEDTKDILIADELRIMLENINSSKLIREMMDGIARSYSCIEIIWDTSEKQWHPKDLIWRDQRFFTFDQDTLSELRLLDESAPVEGLPLDPFKWIIYQPQIKTGIPIRGGLARLVAFSHMAKSYSLKDWMAFAEVFGMPLRLGRYPRSATADDQAKLLTAVANLGTDAAAIIPESMMIDFISSQHPGGGSAIYHDLAVYLDKQVSKAVLGQTMTTDDGSSLAQAKVHETVRTDIKESDAVDISLALNKYLIKPWVILNYGKQIKYPLIKLAIPEIQDLEKFSKAVAPMIDRGLPVEIAQILDKYGLVEPAEGAALLHPVGAQKMEESKNFATFIKALNQGKNEDVIDDVAGKALKDWEKQMDPVLQPILELSENSESVEEFEKGLNDILGDMDTKYLTKRLATAMFISRGIGDATDKV
jgi:phage gp29-like protein